MPPDHNVLTLMLPGGYFPTRLTASPVLAVQEPDELRAEIAPQIEVVT